MRRQRAHPSMAAIAMAFGGAVLVLIGFWLPWVIIRPKSVLGDIVGGVGDVLGLGGGLGHHLVESTSIHFSGWALATGVTVGDILSQIGGGWGEYIAAIGQQVDPESNAILAQPFIHPLVWLFIFPLLAIIILLLLFKTARFGEVSKAVPLLGLAVFVLFSAHILLVHAGFQKAIEENPEVVISTALMEIKPGMGAWFILVGGFLTIVGGFIAPSPSPRGRRLSSSRRLPYSRGSSGTLLRNRRRPRRSLKRAFRSRRW